MLDYFETNFTNDTRDKSAHHVRRPNVYEIFKYVECSFGLLGCFGNVMSLAVLTRNKLRRNVDSQENVVYFGLLAITISDLLFCLTIIPKAAVNPSQTVYKSRTDFEAIYNLYGSSLLTTFTLWSVWFVVVTAAMRYIGICHPLKARYLINKKGIFTVLIVVVIGCTILNYPSFFMYEMNEDCEIDVGYLFPSSLEGSIFIYVKFFLGTFIPFVLLIFFNTRLIIALRKSEKFRKLSSPYSLNLTTASRKKLLSRHTRILENISKKYSKAAKTDNNQNIAMVFCKNKILNKLKNGGNEDVGGSDNDNHVNIVCTSETNESNAKKEPSSSEKVNPAYMDITELNIITTVTPTATITTTTSTNSINAAVHHSTSLNLNEVRNKITPQKNENLCSCCRFGNLFKSNRCNLSKPLARNSSNRLTVILIIMTCFYIIFILPCEIIDLDYNLIMTSNFSWDDPNDAVHNFSESINSTESLDDILNADEEFKFDHYSLTPHLVVDFLYVIIFSSNFLFYSILNVHFRQTLKAMVNECVCLLKANNNKVIDGHEEKSCWKSKKGEASENSGHFSSLHMTERTNVQIFNGSSE